LHEAGELSAIAHVTAYGQRLSAKLFYLGDRAIDLRLRARRADDFGPCLGKSLGDATPNSAPGAGDQRDSIREAKTLQKHGRSFFAESISRDGQVDHDIEAIVIALKGANELGQKLEGHIGQAADQKCDDEGILGHRLASLIP
jgi:hypothetical protein